MEEFKVLISWKNEDGSTFHVNVTPSEKELEQVRFSFNPVESDDVNIIKLLSAALIRSFNKLGYDNHFREMAEQFTKSASRYAVKLLENKVNND